MDQNQTVDNDLQKAIDDITNTTNDDPVFSDPVAAPSSIPEGDTGELGESVGPFPEPIPEPTPRSTIPNPSITNNMIDPTSPQTTPVEPNFASSATPPVNPMPDSIGSTTPEPTPGPTSESANPAVEATVQKFEIEAIPQASNVEQVKRAALRDLMPILEKVDSLTPSQKFKIYRDSFEDLRDYTILESALNAARGIPDETERAEALLYIVESSDKA